MPKINKSIFKREFELNMPQMSFYGLSEQWLTKELGDMHWAMLCDSFGCKSDALIDSAGNRLYSSFVRVRFQSSTSLGKFDENEKITLKGLIKRFGNKIFFSDISIGASKKKINASLMTVFVARKTDNKSLEKSVPIGEENCKAEALSSMPEFANEYFNLKKEMGESGASGSFSLNLGKEAFGLTHGNLFSTTYEINPYTDLNGVNLLYFAAYPLINDTCERRYFDDLKKQLDIKGDWALESSTIARDIFYFGNCDIDDKTVFRLDSCDFVKDNKIKLVSSLIREKDNMPMAKIFTLKQLTSV